MWVLPERAGVGSWAGVLSNSTAWGGGEIPVQKRVEGCNQVFRSLGDLKRRPKALLPPGPRALEKEGPAGAPQEALPERGSRNPLSTQ